MRVGLHGNYLADARRAAASRDDASSYESDDLAEAHGGTLQRMRLSDDIIGTARKAAGGPSERSLGPMTKVPPERCRHGFDMRQTSRERGHRGQARVVPLASRRTAASPRGYSITSSARPRRESGTVMPSAFAVFKLITNSILVGCSTGRSAGLAPFKILSTKSAP